MFQPFEYQGFIIHPSEMLRNQEHMAQCVKLSDLLDIKLKVAIQASKTYMHCLFRVLSTTSTPSENKHLASKWKSHKKFEKVVI